MEVKEEGENVIRETGPKRRKGEEEVQGEKREWTELGSFPGLLGQCFRFAILKTDGLPGEGGGEDVRDF